jgi:hypothetical protein
MGKEIIQDFFCLLKLCNGNKSACRDDYEQSMHAKFQIPGSSITVGVDGVGC